MARISARAAKNESVVGTSDDPAHGADEAVEMMLIDRDRAVELATLVVRAHGDDHVSLAKAHRVLASVATHRGDLENAAEHADAAVRFGEMGDDEEATGWALLTRMGVRISTGDAERAIDDSVRAEPLLPPDGRVRLLIQRGTTLGLGLGRIDEAIATYDEVERSFDELEPIVEAVLTMNRGTQLTARGDHLRALSDFGRARTLYRALGNVEAECDVLLHEARSAASIGDIPTVFALHAEVEERNLLASRDHRTANDLAEALLLVGLRDEAEAMSRRAVALVGDAISSSAIAESLLRLAALRGSLGAPQEAERLCESVRSWAEDRSLAGLVLDADRTQLMMLANAQPDQSLVGPLIELANRFHGAGRPDDALDVRVEAAAIALTSGALASEALTSDAVTVDEILATVPSPASIAGRDSSAIDMARLRHAEALRLAASGSRGPAMRQLSAGLDALDSMRSQIGAMDVRAAMVGRAPELAAFGLALAAESGRPRSVLRWAERQRAVAMRLTSAGAVGPPTDALERVRASGSADSRAAAEHDIVRDIRTQRQSTVIARPSTDVDIVEKVALVDDRVLIEFIDVGGRLDALVIRSGRVRHVRSLGAVDEMIGLVERIRFGLRRLNDSSDGRRRAASDLVDGIALELDDALIKPFVRGAAELVIVPSGPLHLLPWGVLPSVRRQPFVVAPSAHAWLTAHTQRSAGLDVCVIDGPDLPCAAEEAEAVGAIYGDRAVRPPSTVGAAIEAINAAGEAAGIVHVVAHGSFRNDNPHFSSLSLGDGPLFVYDLDGLPDLPAHIVLSACSVGTVSVLRGDEVLGFPAAMLARGTASVVAAMLPVEDQASRDLMIAFHAELETGVGSADALHTACASVRDRSDFHRVAADGFVAFGANRSGRGPGGPDRP